uniref:Uncharacterized protein n=1 Tax=Rhizophora mucronata TaxID=61149 RepID=A0A2P2IHL9_RHIMU
MLTFCYVFLSMVLLDSTSLCCTMIL